MDGTARSRSIPLLRYSDRDAILIALSLVYAGLLIAAPSIPLIGAGLWWTANTVAHNFIHTPFFRSRILNRVYALFLSAVMGVPQSLWRARHLRHHGEDHQLRRAGRDCRQVSVPALWSRDVAVELIVVLAIWIAMAAIDSQFFLLVYAPGYAIGLCLCSLQGHFEHARGTTSHYGWLYNWCFFYIGYINN